MCVKHDHPKPVGSILRYCDRKKKKIQKCGIKRKNVSIKTFLKKKT